MSKIFTFTSLCYKVSFLHTFKTADLAQETFLNRAYTVASFYSRPAV